MAAPIQQGRFTRVIHGLVTQNIKGFYVGDGISRLWGSIPCLLKHGRLESPMHQQAWYWLCKTNNMYCCSRVNFICLRQDKSKIRFKMPVFLSWKQDSMLRVKDSSSSPLVKQPSLPHHMVWRRTVDKPLSELINATYMLHSVFRRQTYQYHIMGNFIDYRVNLPDV